MSQHGATMAFAACKLTAAPLFIAHTKVLAPAAALDGVPRNAGFSAGVSAICGPEMMAAASLGGMAIAVAGMKPKRRGMKTLVHAAAPEAEFYPAKEIGAMAPLGFFDPAGFTKSGGKEKFNKYRAAEIKHGRVAMMAALGAVVQHFVKFPGFEKVPAGCSAVLTAPGSYGFIALFVVAGGLELAIWVQDPGKEPGDFGNPAGLGSYDDDMRNKEINNGRFAMFAALGIIVADLLTGKDAFQQFGV
eukprot:CAMPEP_0172724684 /NCGR_PEP_ID=MMETSP1074-20121228/86642_1 /TAXON_ID=2916 /ORGANISM="Ceratium fusus, Strain PA161109" /LENGTH=245 /DNA_ID=CAMNT_0013551235 /DNA_START=28 /DNA_END=765 /DNA_ORIENTATION=+